MRLKEEEPNSSFGDVVHKRPVEFEALDLCFSFGGESLSILKAFSSNGEILSLV